MGEYLPLGTVVILKGFEPKVFIIGYAQQQEGQDKIWDYLGCEHPTGVISPEKNLLFNQDQIEKVIHLGYSDKEGMDYRNALAKELKK